MYNELCEFNKFRVGNSSSNVGGSMSSVDKRRLNYLV